MGSREHWGTRVGLVLAMAGNAVGLGNFLRFPAQAVQNGGGAFLIPYLVSFVLMGIPLLWIEWSIGRYGGQFGHHSAPGMFDRLGQYRWLKYVGVFGLFTNFAVAAYYCYIESWTLAYVYHSLTGTFKSANPAEFFNTYLGVHEDSLFALPGEALLFFILTLGLNTFILSQGIKRGIEVAAMIGMPLLLLFGAVLAVRGLTLTESDPGVVNSPLVGLNFLWEPKFEGLWNPSTWLAAAGQVFFTLSLGLGSVHCYAAYVRQNQDIALNAASAGWMNEFVEIVLGGTILIPIAVAYIGLNDVQSATAGGSGFGLAFMTLPTLFHNWGEFFGPIACALWFGLLFFAGITSSLAMGQPLIAFLQDEYDMKRVPSAIVFGVATFLLGFFCVWLFPGGAFGEFDFWTGTFSLVVFATAEALIFSLVFGINRGWEEITRGADMKVPRFFRYVIQFVTPAFLVIVFLGAVFQPAGGDWLEALRNLAAGDGWAFHADSVIGKVMHVGDEKYAWYDEHGRGTPAMVQDLTRLLLSLLFVGCGLLVWNAWRRKGRLERRVAA